MKRFDISDSDFATIRTEDKYYVDKTLLIQEFVDRKEKITLITRPRRFGKTTAMTMLADFFDVEKDSRERFQGLQIMETEYASLINTRPVIFLSFRDCDGSTAEELCYSLNETMYYAFEKLESAVHSKLDKSLRNTQKFLSLLDKLQAGNASYAELKGALELLIRICQYYYQKEPLVLIDEYDQPLLASHIYQYHDKVGTALAAFYTSALKDNPYVYRALMTGIQRMAKESIFSKFNNPAVYTVLDRPYRSCFGFTEEETSVLLEAAGLELDESVKEMYDGYRFAGLGIYNPSSVMGYAQNHELKSYWLNTSGNQLIHEAINSVRGNDAFLLDYEELLEHGKTTVIAALDTAFAELQDISALWGLLLNAGYLTVQAYDEIDGITVAIPNKEVRGEFIKIISNEIGTSPNVLQSLFRSLETRNMEQFLKMYRKLILTSTSYYDGKENAYHMFFLGMCIFLQGRYKVTSNLESGLGRHDIMFEPLKAGLEPVIVEFKQINAEEKKMNLVDKSRQALQQIKDLQYYAPLHGDILMVGIAHQGKRCEMAYEIFEN